MFYCHIIDLKHIGQLSSVLDFHMSNPVVLFVGHEPNLFDLKECSIIITYHSLKKSLLKNLC